MSAKCLFYLWQGIGRGEHILFLSSDPKPTLAQGHSYLILEAMYVPDGRLF